MTNPTRKVNKMKVLSGFVLAAVALMQPGVRAHGAMTNPPARNVIVPYAERKGANMWGGNNAGGWPTPTENVPATAAGGVPEQCGGLFEWQQPGNVPGPTTQGDLKFEWRPELPIQDAQTVMKNGAKKLRVQISLSANHGGKFKFVLCNDRLSPETCFDATIARDDGTKASEYWVTYPFQVGADISSNQSPNVYTMDLDLPSDSWTCDKCIVQWTFYTAHHCIPWENPNTPCDRQDCKTYADIKNPILDDARQPGKTCTTLNPSKGNPPQIFRNCADIRVA